MSKSFKQKSEEDWRARLEDVHRNAWEVWQHSKDQIKELSGHELGENEQAQEPGTVPEDVIDCLRVEVAGLPPPHKYAKS